MIGSRTIKTLVALLASMTIGAFVLMALETAPVAPRAELLAALAAPGDGVSQVVHDTAVPLQSVKWRTVVVHSSAEGNGIVRQCHFVVSKQGQVSCTDLWRRQVSGRHIRVPGRDFNADSIAVCLVGDFSSSDEPISQSQFNGLVSLTLALQRAFRIPAARVYLRRDLDAYSDSPGKAFPANAFDARLVRRFR